MRRSGFTLVEVMIAAVVLTVAVLGLMSLGPQIAGLTEASEDSNLARAGVHQVAEAIRQYADQSFAYTWRAFNTLTGDKGNRSLQCVPRLETATIPAVERAE